MRRRFARWRASTSGSAAVEFSFIAPVLILLGAGAFELTRAFQARSAIDMLASQYAIVYADCVDLPAGTCNTELSSYSASATVKNLAPLLVHTVTLQMFQVVMNGATPQVTYAYPSGAALTAAQSAAASAVLTSGQTGVVVTVSYTYTLDVFPGVLNGMVPSSIPMSYTVAQLKA